MHLGTAILALALVAACVERPIVTVRTTDGRQINLYAEGCLGSGRSFSHPKVVTATAVESLLSLHFSDLRGTGALIAKELQKLGPSSAICFEHRGQGYAIAAGEDAIFLAKVVKGDYQQYQSDNTLYTTWTIRGDALAVVLLDAEGNALATYSKGEEERGTEVEADAEPEAPPHRSNDEGENIACRLNSDCEVGFQCRSAACVPYCREDRDCASGQRCSRAAAGYFHCE